QPYFYLNNGDGTFTESAGTAGLHVRNRATGKPVAKALALLPFDFNRDGNLDLFVANDTVRNFLYVNKGGGVFEEGGEEAGVAYDGTGSATGAMGVDANYYRDDDSVGLGVGNFANEMSSFYVSEDGQFFSDEAIGEGIGPVSRQMLSFGLFFFDYDLDGRFDLFQTNGHLEEEINKVQPSQHYRQPSQLFWNCGTGFKSCFVPVDEKTTGDLAKPVVGRGAAYADIDGDGDLDCLITQTGDRPLLLRNDQEGGNNWLRLKLVGRLCNRDAIGATVTLVAGGARIRQQVMPSRSYLSQVETVLTFGLGAAKQAEELRIRWPGDKKVQVVRNLQAGKLHRIEQD
ncbi:MAG: CRTAC1 family protein, partial [Planctomycetota bacterium]|nr:CRTAC1 family protein [Planctomycetota bacterium]